MHGLALLSCAAFAVLAAAPRSQVVQVPASGCAQATWPTATGAPRLGQQVDFAWTAGIPSRQVVAMLGSATGGGVQFFPPVTCDSGPCTWFPGPVGGIYHFWPVQLGSATWSLPIPSDPRLVGTAWGVQCFGWCP